MELHHRPKATMNYGVAVLFLFFLAAEAKVARLSSCGFPNATDVKPNIFSCNTEAPIQVSQVHIRDPSGKDIYPINPKQPIVLDLTAVNHGVQYNDDKANVKLYEYASNWLTGECAWQEIPTTRTSCTLRCSTTTKVHAMSKSPASSLSSISSNFQFATRTA
uniref:Secreted protein n=1 Tax=Steinernema glaseri TaxID=37863 RepID=A0A1I7ZGN2_9BILA